MKTCYIEDNGHFERLWSHDGRTFIGYADRSYHGKWELFDELLYKTCDIFEIEISRGSKFKEITLKEAKISEKNLFLMFL